MAIEADASHRARHATALVLAVASLVFTATSVGVSAEPSDAGFGPVRLGDTESSLAARGYDCKSAPHRDRMCIASGVEALGLPDATLVAYLERDAVGSIELQFPHADAAAVARRVALRFGDLVTCDGVDCKGTLAGGATVASQGSRVVLGTRDHASLVQMRAHMALQLRIWCGAPGEKTEEQRRECAASGN